MDGYHIMELKWTVTMTSTYIDWLPKHRITTDDNHNIYLQWTVTILWTYSGRLP
jgi:hypothetical protein